MIRQGKKAFFVTCNLFSATCLALVLAPSLALAQNECGLQVGTTPVECGDASYGSGVTYDAVGDLFIEFTNPTVTTIGGNGVALTGDGVEGIDFDSATTATELQSAGTTGPLLGVTTEDGDIVIATEEMDADASAAGVTHGIFAQSTGTGSIDITTTGRVDAQGANPADAIGIEAITGGGNIDITSTDNVVGNQFGIRAEAGGSGTLDITVSGGMSGGTAAIDATTGTGLLTINVIGTDTNSFSDRINGRIRTDAGGDAQITIASRTINGGLDLNAAGETTVNTAGNIQGGIDAAGGSLILNNDGRIGSVLDFSELTDGYTFNNNAGGLWDAVTFSGVPQRGDLGGGAINNAGTIELSRSNFISAPGATFTGIGDGMLEMRNVILDGRGQSDCTAPTATPCLDLTGGTTAGQTAILFQVAGTNPDSPFLDPLARPISPGVVVVDVSGGSTQADHFVLHPDSFWRFDRDPGTGFDVIDTPIYAEDPVYGAVLETGGLFDYALLYNPNTQQHLLASVPQHETLEYVAMIHESLSVWHTTSDAVAGRQADLRDGGERGGWVRVFTDKTERDFKPTVTTHGNTFTYDRSYELDTRGVIAGYDLSADENHVFGVHLGFMGTRLDHDDSPTNDEAEFLSGASSTFGAYAGWWNESGLTLDGTLNVNLLDIQHDVRDGLEDTRTNVITTGIRGEAGWRFPLSEAFYVQPLATAAYAYADVERLNMRDYDAKFEDEQSMRAALGVRLGGGTDLSNGRLSRVKYWLTARVWEEYAEDGNVQFLTSGDPLVIEDDISEGFEEVGLGVSLTSSDENLEVFLSGNIRSGDQTDGNNVTVGARLNW